MTLRRARSIGELYEQVSGADLVLSAEAPLTLALDRRITKPRIGRLAATPRSHASGELVPDDLRPLFIQLATETDFQWKQSVRALQLCLDCWNRSGELESILEYREFDTPAVRTVVGFLLKADSSYHKLAEQTISVEDDFRVIDTYGLTELDRQLLPESNSYETVSPFADGEWSLPDVHLYSSATAIVDELVATIDAEHADRVGIVLDQSSIYSPLVEASLDAKGVPYQGGSAFIDSNDVRQFIRFLRAGFAGRGLTVSDIRPLLTTAGVDIGPTYDEQRIEHVDAEWAATFTDIRESIRFGTFADALDTFDGYIGGSSAHLRTLRAELEALNLDSEGVTEQLVNHLEYYLQSFDVPVERDSDGVLLTDAGSTAYVDRPVVFYLGLGEGWAQTPPDYPWVDTADFVERDMRRFELLIQNGQQQHFLVQDSVAGETVNPCVHLRELLDEAFETFSELPHIEHRGEQPPDRTEPFPAPECGPTERVDTISQSTLKRLVNCPRDHFFHRLVDSAESLPMARGTVLHEAVELAVNHPGFVEESRESMLTAMGNQLQPYLSDHRREVLRTRLDVGLDVVTEYLDEDPPADASFETYGAGKDENELAERLGLTVDSLLTERWFEASEIGGRGYVDLLLDRSTLVDFKSGQKRSVSDVHKQAALDEISDRPDFQVLLYLTHHRRECPGEELQFRFVYLLEAVSQMVKGVDVPVSDLVTTITYVPCSFGEFVTRRTVFDELTDYADSNARCKVLNKLGYEQYRAFFEDHQLPPEGNDPETRRETRETFEELAVTEIGDYKYVTEGCETIFDDLASAPAGYYLEDDIDAFESFLKSRIEELNEYRTSRFPVSFDEDDPTWDRVDHRDLILTDR